MFLRSHRLPCHSQSAWLLAEMKLFGFSLVPSEAKPGHFFWQYSEMPQGFLNQAAKLTCGVHQVALGPNGEWFAIFADRDRSTIFGNTSDEFAAAVDATKDTAGRMQVSWVAFGP